MCANSLYDYGEALSRSLFTLLRVNFTFVSIQFPLLKGAPELRLSSARVNVCNDDDDDDDDDDDEGDDLFTNPTMHGSHAIQLSFDFGEILTANINETAVYRCNGISIIAV